MKKLLTIALLFGIYSLSAQNLQIGDGQVKHDNEMRPCIEVALEPSTDNVKNAWLGYLKKEYKVKLKGHGFMTNKDVLYAEGIKFKQVSDKKMDFFTRIVEEDNRTKMYVYSSFGYDIYINRQGYPLEFKRLEDITKRFLNNYLPEFYTNQLKDTQKKLEDLKKDKSNMEKEIEENEKEMKRLNERNEELARELPNKNQSIEETTQMMQNRENNWSQIKDKLSSFNIKKD